MITDYHSKYLASDLVRRRSSDSSDKLAVAVAGAQVDMNPHQVDAALFAFASPLSKGALLADEVGLGKTIEAGLVISQSLIQNYPAYFHSLAMRRVKSWMEATKSQAVADAMVCSKSLARRRLRFSQASVRSTTQRRGRTSKPLAVSDRLMISMVHLLMRRSASLSLFPALRLPGKAGAQDKLRRHRRRYDAATGSA